MHSRATTSHFSAASPTFAASRGVSSAPPRGRRGRGAGARAVDSPGEARERRPWAVSLARVFEWEDVLEASSGDGYDDESTSDDDETGERTGKASAPTRGTSDEFVIVDGANVAWGLAQKLKSRFQAKTRVPMSAAVVMALD